MCGPFGCTAIQESVTYAFDLAKNPPAPDTTPPVMAQPGNLSIATSQSSGSIPVSYTQPTASDNRDGTISARCTPGSGANFTIGATTTVTCTARDAAGNTTTRSFTITVAFSPASVLLSGGV
ncbi:MAG TPA: HYR domain-containing protein, partial [Ilumatobacteraceae bacterium]|nr:HYR domain-containing protein [Ilumatobacteraceae bacterium]